MVSFKKLKRKDPIESESNEVISWTKEIMNNLWRELEVEKEKNCTLLKKISELELKEANYQNIIDLNKDEISRLKYQIDEIIQANNMTIEMITANSKVIAEANKNGHFLILEESNEPNKKKVKSNKLRHSRLTPDLIEKACTFIGLTTVYDHNNKRCTCIDYIDKDGYFKSVGNFTNKLNIEFLDDYEVDKDYLITDLEQYHYLIFEK